MNGGEISRNRLVEIYGDDYPFYLIWKSSVGKCNNRKHIKNNTLTLFDIKDVWIKQNGLCDYSGIELILPNKNSDMKNILCPSVDRIDSNLGYSKDNVHLVMKSLNRMKFALTEQRFLELCRLVSIK